ncbi:hypothetical protein [Methylogaea oryzae]|uniref:hypothetical protein n=1 Tax=Methylogaea oryzae TaxID=1295382 RepID=UPI0012E2A15B|nr:hypothetical protein [Methylogaea oryzae]
MSPALGHPPGIALLTHADSDLIALRRAVDTLPADFPLVSGHSLQSLAAQGQVLICWTATCAMPASSCCACWASWARCRASPSW